MIQDANGFVRLRDLDGFDKFISLFKRMSVTTPENPHDCLYKDYNVKSYYSARHGELGFAPMCEAEMFIKRVSKHFPTGWMLISTKKDGKRTNTIAYVYSYDYTNTHRHNFQTIVVHYYSDGFGKMFLNVDDLKNIAYHPLSEEEIKVLQDYKALVSKKPFPIYALMVLKPEYKEDYKLYLADCKKYGFKPIDKKLIKRVELTTIDGKPTTFSPDGHFGYLGDDDQEIVNK